MPIGYRWQTVACYSVETPLTFPNRVGVNDMLESALFERQATANNPCERAAKAQWESIYELPLEVRGTQIPLEETCACQV